MGLGVVVGGWLLFFQHFKVLTSISPAESTGPASRGTLLRERCLFLFSFPHHFICSINCILMRDAETPPPVAVARSFLNKSPWRRGEESNPSFSLQRVKSLPGKETQKDGLKGNLNDFFLFKKNETKQIPFLKTKIRSRIKCISELSDLTEAKAVF